MPVTEKQKGFILAKARALCAENDAELLFLTLSGFTREAEHAQDASHSSPLFSKRFSPPR
jgi:hypothetical protein